MGVEYQSAALTQHFTLWLIQAAVSPDLIRLGLRVVDDELLHAELAARVARAAGAELEAVDRASLLLPCDESRPLEAEIVRVCISNYCLAETAAVRIFRALRQGCRVPVARAALDRVLRDEVRHRDFGWELLGWLLQQPGGAALRAQAQSQLPSLLAEVRATYLPNGVERRRDWLECADEDRAWGLMPLAEYRDALDLSFARDLVPRFARLGILA